MGDLPFSLVGAEGPTAGCAGHLTLRVEQPVEAAALVHDLVKSRAMVARIFNKGQLNGLDGMPVSRADLLCVGTEIQLQLMPTRAPGPASDAPVNVLYQDAFLLAADKPAGILVHGDGTGADTLTARVQGLVNRQGSAVTPQALHRLDVETSGVVLFSLVEETQPALDALIAGDCLAKRYVAVIEGTLPRSREVWLTIDAPIARDRHDARRMRVGRTGKPSITRVRTLDVRGGRSLIEAELGTGRRHQIRVHLAHLGHPLVGDALYGGRRNEAGLMLHAKSVRLLHPVTGEPLVIVAPAPKRFSSWL